MTAFVERARELERLEPGPRKDELLELLQVKCWPELVKLAEAASKFRTGDPHRLPHLQRAIDALDRKAGG